MNDYPCSQADSAMYDNDRRNARLYAVRQAAGLQKHREVEKPTHRLCPQCFGSDGNETCQNPTCPHDQAEYISTYAGSACCLYEARRRREQAAKTTQPPHYEHQAPTGTVLLGHKTTAEAQRRVDEEKGGLVSRICGYGRK